MTYDFAGRGFWRRTLSAAKRLIPPRLTPPSREGRLLAALWTLAALITLGVALSQSLLMFLLSMAAVLFGTYAALWAMNGAARR
ncbi:MAG: hypothetical protein H7236_18310 [Gemmatimonadaceae bacterium]|nr:hypothetical protein [Caulobacter sp.]